MGVGTRKGNARHEPLPVDLATPVYLTGEPAHFNLNESLPVSAFHAGQSEKSSLRFAGAA
jgi:hypothetical protein